MLSEAAYFGTTSMNAPEPIRNLDSRCQRHETRCGDAMMVWRSWGSGQPLLLLHGSHGSWMHWVRNIAALESNHRVLVPDMPGYGESAPPLDVDSPESHAEAIARGLSDLVPTKRPIDVVGFSLGAFIGAHLPAVAPQLIRRLVIVDAGGLGTPMPMVHLKLKSLRALQGEELLSARRHNLRTMMIHDPDCVDELALWIDANAPRPVSRVHHQVIPDKLLDALGKVPVQIDAIWGENDQPHPNPEANAAALRQLQPSAALRTVSGAGHWSMYEGADEFNRHLRELLNMPLRGPARGDA
jgi:2-hydroxy-6-oxonona-2,4-dienedioate hydrolase